MLRFVLTLMLVLAVCIHPAVHLVTEVGRLFSSRPAVKEVPKVPPEREKTTATKREAEATAQALLRGPNRQARREIVEEAKLQANLLDVAGEFLEAMEDPGRSGTPMFLPRDGLKGEDQLERLVKARHVQMESLVLQRDRALEANSHSRLNRLMRNWLVSCKEAIDGFASPNVVLADVEKTATSFNDLVAEWAAKNLPIGEETTSVAKRWGNAQSAFRKLAEERASDRLAGFARLHAIIDTDEGRRALREVARDWLEKWLPRGDLPIDPYLNLYESNNREWEPWERTKTFIVLKSAPNKGSKMAYDPSKGVFAEFDRESGPEAEAISHISRTGNVQDNFAYTRIRPTEWSRVANGYNRGRIRTDIWTYANLDAWRKECTPHVKVVAGWKEGTRRSNEKPPSGDDLAKIERAYQRLSAVFECLDDCKALFPNPLPEAKEK